MFTDNKNLLNAKFSHINIERNYRYVAVDGMKYNAFVNAHLYITSHDKLLDGIMPEYILNSMWLEYKSMVYKLGHTSYNKISCAEAKIYAIANLSNTHLNILSSKSEWPCEMKFLKTGEPDIKELILYI